MKKGEQQPREVERCCDTTKTLTDLITYSRTRVCIISYFHMIGRKIKDPPSSTTTVLPGMVPYYQLSTINYQLSTINYQLSTINYQLS